MEKIYQRFVASTDGGSYVDDRWAFEVTAGRIIFHKVSYTGWWPFIKVHYEPTGASVPISKETTVNLWLRLPPGSGMCKVMTGSEGDDFHVYGEAEAFTAHVEREVARCRSAS